MPSAGSGFPCFPFLFVFAFAFGDFPRLPDVRRLRSRFGSRGLWHPCVAAVAAASTDVAGGGVAAAFSVLLFVPEAIELSPSGVVAVSVAAVVPGAIELPIAVCVVVRVCLVDNSV